MGERSIQFKHLHILLPTVGDRIEVFGFDIMFYGIVIAFGMFLAGILIVREGKRQGMPEEDLLDVVLWGVIWGVIGARIYYVLFSLSSYRGRWLSVFNIREGGLAIYGGVIGGTLAIFYICKKRGLSFWGVADICVLGALIGQICGRWGNFFNREAFGGYSNGVLSMQIPICAVRQPEAITDEMMKHSFSEYGIEWISVHPTFLYESLWNVGVFLLLYFYVRPRKTWDGEVFFSYLFLYGAGRFWIEGLRTDSLMFFGSSFAVSQCLAAACVIISTGVIYFRKHEK